MPNPLFTARAASIFLAIIGLIYLAHGSYKLFTFAGDFQMRWVEQHYVFKGQNPLDVLENENAIEQNTPPPANGRNGSIDPSLGFVGAGYPPWAYFTGAVFTWPHSMPVARVYYGVINIALLALLLLWAYSLGIKENQTLGILLCASLFAVNSICTTFIVGQYGVVVLSALVAAYLLDERKHWLASGICLGIALTKVTLSGPFLLPFLFKRRWRVLAATGCYLSLGSLVVWHAVKTNPAEMLSQMMHASEGFQKLGYSLNNVLELAGVGVQSATKWAALISILAAIVLLYLWRSSSMLVLYAIAGLAARAWCYHALYDNLILVFMLLALGLAAWRRPCRLSVVSVVLLGASLWIPGRAAHAPLWLVTQWGLWAEGLVALLILDYRSGSQNEVTKS